MTFAPKFERRCSISSLNIAVVLLLTRKMVCHCCRIAARALKDADYSLARIAKIYRRHKSTVQRWLNPTKKAPRKPMKKPSIAMQLKIRKRREAVAKCIREEHCKVASTVRRTLQLSECCETIRRDLRSIGAKARVRPKSMTMKPGDEQKRLAYARKLLRDPWWKQNCVLSDEKSFDLCDRGQRFEWVLPGERRRVRGQSHTTSVNFFGALGPNGFKFLCVVPPPSELGEKHFRYEIVKPKANPNERRGRPRMPVAQLAKNKRARRGFDSEAFIDCVLKPWQRLRGSPKSMRGTRWKSQYTLMHDNCGPWSEVVRTWCASNGIKTQPYKMAARFADCNVVENMWSRLQYAVNRDGVPRTKQELISKVFRAFAELDTQRLYADFELRLKRVVQEGGRLLSR